MWNEMKESCARAEASVDRARFDVEQQGLFISSTLSSDPRLDGARKLLRQMEQSLASADLSLAICRYDDDAFDARKEAYKASKAC